jgi:predicted AlkP superfamily phosphohydrolase/phosphomutase
MSSKTRTNLLDLPLSLLLGVVFCGLLGYSIALRVIQLNPDLTQNFRSMFFLLLSSSGLYTVFGLMVGLGLWVVLFVFSRVGGAPWRGRRFVQVWLIWFLTAATLESVYFMMTRQHLRSGTVDNPLLIVWLLATIFMGILLYLAVKSYPRSVARRRKLNLPRYLLLFIIILVCVTGLSITLSRKIISGDRYGSREEVKAALSNLNWDTKVLIIGWDGGEWSVINRLIEQGRLPNLKRLMDGGVHAKLRSLPSTKSPLIWTSIVTGKVPEKHGIQDFGSFQFPGMVNNFSKYPDGLGYYRLISRLIPSADIPVTSTTRRTAAIWEILSSAKQTVGMIGWWATWPTEPVEGFMISDRFTYTLFNPRATAMTLRQGQTYPPELLDEVSQFIRTPSTITDAEYHRFLPNLPNLSDVPDNWKPTETHDWNPMNQLRLAYTAAESYKNTGLYLYQKIHPAFLSIYFQGTDMVSHYFWQYYRPEEFISVSQNDAMRYGSVIPEFYSYLDEALGDYLKIISPDTDVLVLSDHGFGNELNPHAPFRTGEHRMQGIFVASGPHFQKGVTLDEISVLDIMPTLLYLYNLPRGKDMDGQIALGVLDSVFVSDHPATEIKSYDTGPRTSTMTRSVADTEVKNQIKALGYTN